MQPLEYSKDSLLILRRDSDPVVPDGKDPAVVLPLRRHFYAWRSGASILDRVSDEILKKLLQVNAVYRKRGHRPGNNLSLAFHDGGFQVGKCRVQTQGRV